MDAIYLRVSSERQTIENQVEDLLQIAEKDGSNRNWPEIRRLLAECVHEEQCADSRGETRILYRVYPEVASELAALCAYVEQGRSSRRGAKSRPLFEQMKRDAALRKFDRLLVWKVSRLGRDMREVISTVYDLADLGITVVPVKSPTGPIHSTMGKLLWAILAWFAEMENEERSETIKAGQARAKANGRGIGRPRAIFRRDLVVPLRKEGLSWSQIARRLGVSERTVKRVYESQAGPGEHGKNLPRVRHDQAPKESTYR